MMIEKIQMPDIKFDDVKQKITRQLKDQKVKEWALGVIEGIQTNNHQAIRNVIVNLKDDNALGRNYAKNVIADAMKLMARKAYPKKIDKRTTELMTLLFSDVMSPYKDLENTLSLVVPAVNFESEEDLVNKQLNNNSDMKNYCLKKFVKLKNKHDRVVSLINDARLNSQFVRADLTDAIDDCIRELEDKREMPSVVELSALRRYNGISSRLTEDYQRCLESLKGTTVEPYLQRCNRALPVLKDEQEYLKKSGAFHQFLEMLNERIGKKNNAQIVYFVYGWPSEHRRREEGWIQPFLATFHNDLRRAGVEPIMDIKDNKVGGSIYKFMEQARYSDYVIMFGSRSLKEKLDDGVTAVATEDVYVNAKRVEDLRVNIGSDRYRVYPVLLSGGYTNAIPARYNMHSTIRDFRSDGYLEMFKTLYNGIYGHLMSSTIELAQKEAFDDETRSKITQYKSLRDEIIKCDDMEMLLSEEEVQQRLHKIKTENGLEIVDEKKQMDSYRKKPTNVTGKPAVKNVGKVDPEQPLRMKELANELDEKDKITKKDPYGFSSSPTESRYYIWIVASFVGAVALAVLSYIVGIPQNIFHPREHQRHG